MRSICAALSAVPLRRSSTLLVFMQKKTSFLNPYCLTVYKAFVIRAMRYLLAYNVLKHFTRSSHEIKFDDACVFFSPPQLNGLGPRIAL